MHILDNGIEIIICIYIYIFIRTRSTHFNINFNTIKQSYRQVNREGHSVHTSFIIAVSQVISELT